MFPGGSWLNDQKSEFSVGLSSAAGMQCAVERWHSLQLTQLLRGMCMLLLCLQRSA
jgi:hypothetical protein